VTTITSLTIGMFMALETKKTVVINVTIGKLVTFVTMNTMVTGK
jgi:hypothetical protein